MPAQGSSIGIDACSRAGSKDAELVAFWIEKDDPRLLTLADVGSVCAQCQKPINLTLLVLWTEVGVDSVLRGLHLCNQCEDHPGSRIFVRTDFELFVAVDCYDPAQRISPPATERLRIGGVNDDLLPLKRHCTTVSRWEGGLPSSAETYLDIPFVCPYSCPYAPEVASWQQHLPVLSSESVRTGSC